jgi:hypothetical protein
MILFLPAPCIPEGNLHPPGAIKEERQAFLYDIHYRKEGNETHPMIMGCGMGVGMGL